MASGTLPFERPVRRCTDLETAEYLGQPMIFITLNMVSAFAFYASKALVPNHEVQQPHWFELKEVFNKENHSKRLFQT